MLQVAERARKKNDVYTISIGWGGFNRYSSQKQNKKHLYVNNFISNALHYKLGTYFGLNGFFSFFATIRMLHFMKKNNVQLIHLHNLHNFCFNLPLLFHFIKRHHIPVIWTLHDCWSFTGRCPHFVMAKCDKWVNGCHHCPYPKNFYPQSYYLDTTHMMWKLKKKWFTGVTNMTIVTPSEWLASLVRQSFLGGYSVKVINNGIDLNVFKPTESDFRNRHELIGKNVVLGVAFGWDKRKGIDVFIELSKRLPENYQIVLVGTSDRVDAMLPANVISIHQTQSQIELVNIYSAANVFVNPTREENFPTVNMEALACGTPVVTFKTGGSPEILDNTCGSVVPCDDIDAMEMEIRRICEEKPFSIDACVAHSQKFDKNARFQEYVNLYKELEGRL